MTGTSSSKILEPRYLKGGNDYDDDEHGKAAPGDNMFKTMRNTQGNFITIFSIPKNHLP
jgi:hypothetical protein